MKIGIVGSGSIGGTAAKLFTAVGHEVAISHAHGPESLQGMVEKLGPKARAVTVDEACEFGDVVLVAIPLGAYASVPADKLAGKIVVDAMNYYPGRDGQQPGAEANSTALFAKHLPRARMVKAFNTLYFKPLAERGRPGAPAEERLVLFVAGDDESAKRTVSELIDQIGFAPIDTGSLAEGAPRQQPGAPIYNKPMKPAEARRLLGG